MADWHTVSEVQPPEVKVNHPLIADDILHFVRHACVHRKRNQQLKMVVVVLMGVCGCGKTTVGETLAEKMEWPFRDADEFHPDANKRKMSSGIPLTDEDRFPWLLSIYNYICSVQENKQSAVLTCSALKRHYRDILRTGNTATSSQVHSNSQNKCQSSSSLSSPSSQILFIYLKGSQEVLEARLQARKGHFMPPGLLASQLETLEEPQGDENCLTVDIADSVKDIVDAAVNRLQNGV